MKVERRIPTILGILIISASLGITVFLFKNIRTYFGRATEDATPAEVKITNISEGGFTVSWITAGNVSGTVSFGENSSLGNIATDDWDQISGKTGDYPTHHVTLRYLKPGVKYYFKIISGSETFDNNGEPYVVTTAPEIGPPSEEAQPVYGTVVKVDGSPATGAIVYLSLEEATPLSTLVRSSGNWLVTLTNARTADLSDFIKLEGDKKIEIYVQAGSQGSAQAEITVANSSPVPQITLGKIYDFSQEATPTPSQTIAPTASPSAKLTLPQQATPSPSLTNPATEAAIPSDRPVFSGTGIPGKTITIKIDSPAPVSETITIDQNGNWTWVPPTGLPPGDHTVTVTTTDAADNPIRFTRNFTVLASGTQVTEPATPSATATPSPTPKPSPKISPSPTATPSPTPPSGNISPTILTLLLSLALLSLGVGRLLLDKS